VKNNLLIIIIILTLSVFGGIVAILANHDLTHIDMVRLNEIRYDVENNLDDFSGLDITDFEIVVINNDGEILYSTFHIQSKTYDHWINWALQNDRVILEFSGGRIFVTRKQGNGTVIAIIIIAILTAIIITVYILHGVYQYKTIYKPFENLKTFASDVAYGNLDNPLLMNKNNAFGAFTESFDILRSELKAAKEKETELEKSKKELVAQLSHDIRTPIASIKAVTELLLLNKLTDKTKDKLEIITGKVSEIDDLITNMFQVTLDDLAEFQVSITELSSKEIEGIIRQADYLGKIKKLSLPDCLINADALRLGQIVGNIINNSYKYAKTEIMVISELADNQLSIEFVDFGIGVKEEELPFIMGKFYRGSVNQSETGAGLGLFICKTLLEKMNGAIDCYNTIEGFVVKIFLPLA